MSEQTIAARVRESVSASRLPRDRPVTAWIGVGQGDLCDGCGDAIRAAAQYELQMADGSVFRLHGDCHGLWLGEMIRRQGWVFDLPLHGDFLDEHSQAV